MEIIIRIYDRERLLEAKLQSDDHGQNGRG